jgi:hypothetical protein
MARQAQAISISDIHEHHAGCADCGTDGRFEQDYVVPLRWMATLLSHVAQANGAKVFLRKQREAKYELVVKRHEAQALEKTEKDFFTLVLLARGEGRFWKPGRMIQHDRLFDVGAAAAPRP